MARFDPSQIVDTPLAGQVGSMLVKQVTKANHSQLLIQVIALDYLFAHLADPAANDHAGVFCGPGFTQGTGGAGNQLASCDGPD